MGRNEACYICSVSLYVSVDVGSTKVHIVNGSVKQILILIKGKALIAYDMSIPETPLPTKSRAHVD